MAARTWEAYAAGSSPVHRLDPRVKLALVLFWTFALLNIESWFALVGVAAVLAGCAALARVPLGRLAAGVAPMAAVLAVLVLANALRFDGTAAWALAGSVGVSPEGLGLGLAAAARVALMVVFSLVLTATTTASALMEAFQSVLGPLRRFGVPVDDLATMLSIALRFIPVCGEQYRRIALAQRARGLGGGAGGPMRHVRAWSAAAIPLMVGLFRRSEALGDAMALRCYCGKGRTSLTTLALRRVDGAVLVIGCFMAVACAWAL